MGWERCQPNASQTRGAGGDGEARVESLLGSDALPLVGEGNAHSAPLPLRTPEKRPKDSPPPGASPPLKALLEAPSQASEKHVLKPRRDCLQKVVISLSELVPNRPKLDQSISASNLEASCKHLLKKASCFILRAKNNVCKANNFVRLLAIKQLAFSGN